MTDPYYPPEVYYKDNKAATAVPGNIQQYPTASKYSTQENPLAMNNPFLPANTETLETMINDTREYGLDISDLVMKDKLKLIGTTASMLKRQIDERSKIRDDNLLSMDYRIMQCESYLDNLDQAWQFLENPMVESKRDNLYHEISNLQNNKLQEAVKCWSDQVRLYSELLTTLGEYQAAIRRFKLLEGDDE
jgi:hypothetical protein